MLIPDADGNLKSERNILYELATKKRLDGLIILSDSLGYTLMMMLSFSFGKISLATGNFCWPKPSQSTFNNCRYILRYEGDGPAFN
jgi:hypothetical protein